MPDDTEPTIVINGVIPTGDQALMIRAAIRAFQASLRDQEMGDATIQDTEFFRNQLINAVEIFAGQCRDLKLIGDVQHITKCPETRG